MEQLPTHPSALMAVLRWMFPGRLVSVRVDAVWSPHSPNLSICDFPVDYLKSKVYIDKPCSLLELRAVAQRKIIAIPENMLQRALRSFIDHLQQCIDKTDNINMMLLSVLIFFFNSTFSCDRNTYY